MRNQLRKSAWAFGALAAMAAPSSALAQDGLDAFYGDAIEITTGYPKSERLAPGVVDVITRADIDAMGVMTLGEVLQRAAGVHVSKNRVGDDVFVFRGFYNEVNAQVLILIDNDPLRDAIYGSRPIAWDMLTPMIERIEIIRGPGSALVGADAYVGVINIITKGASQNAENEVGVFGGSFGTAGGHLIASRTSGDWRLAASVQARRTDGHEEFVAADAQSFADAFAGTSASLAPGPVNTERSEILVRIDANHASGLSAYAWYNGFFNVGNAVSSSFALDPEGERSVDLARVGLRYDTSLSDKLEWSTKANVTFNNADAFFQILPPGTLGTAPPFIFPQGVRNRFQYRSLDGLFETSAIYDAAQHTLRAGAGVLHQRAFDIREGRNFIVTPMGFAPVGDGSLIDVDFLGQPPTGLAKDRTATYVFVQDEWRLANHWTLTVGGRYDHYTDAGGAFSPRASLVWTPTLRATIKALYGAAFRPPAFVEETAGVGLLVNGNPDLEAERIDTYELAAEYDFDGPLKIAVNGYFLETEDMIAITQSAVTGVATFENTPGVRGNGAEVTLVAATQGPFRFEANYAYQITEDQIADAEAGFTPNHLGFAELRYAPTPAFDAALSANFVGDRGRAPGDFRSDVDGYTSVNVSARYRPQWAAGGEVFATVSNAFDDDIRYPSADPLLLPGDLPGPGVSVTAGLRYRF